MRTSQPWPPLTPPQIAYLRRFPVATMPPAEGTAYAVPGGLIVKQCPASSHEESLTCWSYYPVEQSSASNIH